jgi:hypothetical protein
MRTTVSSARGNLGRVWGQSPEAHANHETLIHDLLDDQYSLRSRIVTFSRPPVTVDCYANGLPSTMTCQLL